MAKDPTPTKFRPERPIYLNEENTGYKTKDEVVHAIERLREKGWLCSYNATTRPFHLSFNDDKEFNEFKKACSNLNITLKSPIAKPDDFENLDDDPLRKQLDEMNSKSSLEDPSGQIHIES